MPKQTKASAADAASTPWWIDEGEEDCPHCEQTYAYHVEVRCYACDGPICPMCIVRVGTRMYCPECRPNKGAK